MHRQDRLHRLLAKRRLEPGGIEVEGRGIDVDEQRSRPAECHNVRGRRPGVRRYRDAIAGADVEGQQAEVQGRGAIGDGNGVLGAGVARDGFLELGHLPTLDQEPGLQDLPDGAQIVLIDGGDGETNQRAVLQNSPVRRMPSSRSTCASNPSSSRALATEGTRSSTSTYSLCAKRMADFDPNTRT